MNIDDLKYQVYKKEVKGQQISENFVAEHYSLVEALAYTMYRNLTLPPCINKEDLVSWGLEGLIKAKQKFKPNKGCQFKTYAFYRIKGEILDGLRKEWNYRNPISYKKFNANIQDKIVDVVRDFLGEDNLLDGDTSGKQVTSLINTSAMVYLLSLEELREKANFVDKGLKEEFVINYDKIVLNEELKGLDQDEQQLIKLFYYEGISQKEIAGKLHLSRSKVCRLHKKIIDKLKVKLEKKLLVFLFCLITLHEILLQPCFSIFTKTRFI